MISCFISPDSVVSNKNIFYLNKNTKYQSNIMSERNSQRSDRDRDPDYQPPVANLEIGSNERSMRVRNVQLISQQPTNQEEHPLRPARLTRRDGLVSCESCLVRNPPFRITFCPLGHKICKFCDPNCSKCVT